MNAILAQIIEATDARPTGQDKYFGHCRHHGSKRNRDLSIRLEHDRILVNCFVGCEPEDVCTSIGLKLRDLFLDNKKGQDEIRRDRQARERRWAEAEKKFHAEGAQLDARREAEKLVRTAKDIPDSHTWSDKKRDQMMSALASAYKILEREAT